MIQARAKLIKNIEVAQKCYKILLSCTQIARRAQPGQFVQVRLCKNNEVLLRRPFSIHRVESKNIEILYETVGKGTQILSQRKSGEYLDVIGPLGNGFDYRLPITDYRLPILVAGGMGVAPLLFLAEKLKEIPNPKSQIPNIVLIGAKTKGDILCEKEFKRLGCDVKIATDDGSCGFKGKVTDLLRYLVSSIEYRVASSIYACGPPPMLKEIGRISKGYKIPAQVSLEEHMACGIGACLGCVVDTQEGYKRVCKEGPAFDAQNIIWK